MINIDLWKRKKKELGLTYDEIAEKSGVACRTVIRIFTQEVSNTTLNTKEAIEKVLGLYVGEEERIRQIGGFPLPDNRLVPLVGQVVAGKPIESPECLEGYVYVDYKNPDDYFAVKVKGDSMVGAYIFPNSILIVHKQNYAENKDIIVASVNGESTVKRYHESKDGIMLCPENSTYTPLIIGEKSEFCIFGKVVEIRNKL